LSRISRGIREDLPDSIGWAVKKFCGERVHAYGHGWYDWLCFKPNPLLQFFYVALIFGGYGIYIMEAHPYLPNMFAAGWHKASGAVTIGLCLFSFFTACLAPPGKLNKTNCKDFDNYIYDNLMYEKGKEYVGYGLTKIARSKHDKVTNTIVPRFDHFCGWLNQCVGELNYRYFLRFLLIHACMLTYADFLLGSMLASEIFRQRLFDQTFVNAATGAKVLL
jgi:palmitoyltransferase